jgi:hypothetical protein
MPEEKGTNEPGTLWRGQPEEKRPVDQERFMNRRTRELYSGTRTEILVSVGAALFFVAVMALRFAGAENRFLQVGFVVIVGWVLISLYRFRDRIWRKHPSSPDAVAATGLEYYRRELERRRDHLRSEWVWHGPLVLACLVFVAIAVGSAFPGLGRLEGLLPLIALLAAWTLFGVRRRRRQADEIQREIEEINRL